MISDPNKPKKLSANEGIKENSDFLRGTISESLLDDSTGSIPASDAQLTKFHGTYIQDDRDKRMSLIKEKKEKAPKQEKKKEENLLGKYYTRKLW